MSQNWTSQDIPDQSGRLAVITGASAGLGAETARVLAAKGAHVIMAVRDLVKGETVGSAIRKETPEAQLELLQLDLADLTSVAAFVDRMTQTTPKIDLLINNAGVMVPPEGRTAQGFELQMGTNHLGHFAMTAGLLPMLKASPGARLVVLSSIAHKSGALNFDDLTWTQRRYNRWGAYGASKLANLMFAYEAARRFGGPDLRVIAAHPGATATELMRHLGPAKALAPLFAQSVEMGTLPTLRAATDPDAQNGEYYGPKGFMEIRGAPVKVGSTRASRDEAAAAKLWEMSEELTGVSF